MSSTVRARGKAMYSSLANTSPAQQLRRAMRYTSLRGEAKLAFYNEMSANMLIACKDTAERNELALAGHEILAKII